MKFQDSSFNGLKFTVGTKSVTHPRTLQKQYAPSTFSKLGAQRVGLWTTKCLYEPRCEKSGLQSFRPGPTQTKLVNHTRWLEA